MEFRSLMVCCVIGIVIGLVFVLVPGVVFAADRVYENDYYRVDNDSHVQSNRVTLSLSSESPVYSFLFLERAGAGRWVTCSRTPMVWVSDHTASQNVQYWSYSGFSSSWSEDKMSVADIGFYYTREFSSTQKYTNYLQNYISVSGSLESCYERVYDFLYTGNQDGFDFSVWSGNYDSGIGVLKDVSMRLAYPDGAGNVDRVLSRFYYSSKTTTGYNVESDGTKIRLYESVTYYKRSDDSVYSEGPKILVGTFDATKLQITYNVNDAFALTTESTDSQYIASPWTIVSKQLVRNDRIYLQVIDSSGNYGNYLRIGGQSDNGNKHPQDVVDEDGNIVSSEDGGYSNEDTDTKVGTSDDGSVESAFNDANSKPDPSITIGSIDDAIGAANGMLSMIGNIPIAISKLLSFLPSWCLNYLATVFVALGMLIIYKLIRG